MRQTWTDDEIQFIKNNYMNMTDEEISEHLCVHSVSSVATKRKRLHLTRTNRKYSFEDVKNEFAKTDYILLSEENEYVNSAVNSLRYLCPRHLDKGEQTISLGHLQSGRGCYYCGMESTAMSRRNSDNDIEQDCKLLCDRKGFIYKGFSREDSILYVHFICPYHVDAGIQKMRKGNMERDNIQGCRYCFDTKRFKFSKGEKRIEQVLDLLNIIYLPQHVFQDCRDIHMLPFDYYLPAYNFCIEFDGQHHYMPINFNGVSDERALECHLLTIKHDRIKDEYCLANNIGMLRIPYYQFDDIEQLIINALNIENIA